MQPEVQAAITIRHYNESFGDLDLTGLVTSLTKQTEDGVSGDLARSEAMLVAQAHTLDAIFNNLAQRAINAEYMNNLDSYLKLALRAQSQSRATWEAVSTIKNPPVVYAKQANIAHGHQQVNNGPARENEISQNELLEQIDGERLDTGTTGATSQADPAMATLGEVDRAED